MPPRNRILVEKKDYIKLNQCHLETEYQLKMQEIKSMPLGNWIVVEKEPTRNYRWREWVPLLWLLVRSKENRETWPWREREPTHGCHAQGLRASPRVFKTHFQSWFFKIKNAFQRLLISTLDLSALKKIDPIVRKYTRAYWVGHLEGGRAWVRIWSKDRVLNANIQKKKP